MSLPQSTPEAVRWCSLLLAIVLGCFTALSIGIALRAEWTGTAFYSSNPRFSAAEQVSGDASPKKIQDAMLEDWFRAGLFGCLAIASFYFYRRLSPG